LPAFSSSASGAQGKSRQDAGGPAQGLPTARLRRPFPTFQQVDDAGEA
jgi:hypothetical protein